MVTFLELRDARPELWKSAADDAVALAQLAEESAGDIYERGAAPVGENWTDEVGTRAAANLRRLARRFETAAITLRGVAMTLDGLGESVEALQQTLLSAVDYARRHGLTVSDSGRVSAQEFTRLEVPPEVGQANQIIAEAVESATRIDEEVKAELGRLTQAAADVAAAVAGGRLDEALTLAQRVQQSAAQNQIDLIRESLPIGESPQVVAAWWAALTPDQRAEYERAVPVDLHDLDGIPAEVKAGLRGSDGYDRVETIRWAQEHWDDAGIDIFDNNCANFVSHSLLNGGLEQKMDPWGTWSDNSWGRGLQTGWDWLDSNDRSHSRPWTQSEAQRDFFLDNGGSQVSTTDARPGDVIYFENAGEDRAHHAAVVTAVTPDGDILYTQHTDSQLNRSLDSRLAQYEVTGPEQDVVIVRPRQTW
ncbi:amidase domain-containing protein [Phytohabitans sp. LJ34]|uniref:amidase domain-containing protein n=1 Tax=Phytohabitans sp. LJ34 TaxID=3452217 RepID=UPI003F8C43C9